ncbi:MAG: serine hydrolase [Phycisphaera sp. RhM]|nr:serine hydrolase [Phycisphaera sp. RhM]
MFCPTSFCHSRFHVGSLVTRIATYILLIIGLIPPAVSTAQHPAPELHAQISSLVDVAIQDGDLPGAVVCIADRNQIRYLQTFGDRQVEPDTVPMTADTVFDLASITNRWPRRRRSRCCPNAAKSISTPRCPSICQNLRGTRKKPLPSCSVCCTSAD